MSKEKKIQENDIVLCTVKRIERATVFLEIEGNGEGSMMLSEVAPGRIRNLREYVVPNKKVVCKVLKIQGDHIQLSLRRVTGGERDEVMGRYKKGRVLSNMLKPILKDKTKSTLDKIKESYDLADFLDDAREDPKLLEKFVSKSEFEELKKIFIEKREREKEVVETLKITSKDDSGLIKIKETLSVAEDLAEIHYKGSSKFTISVKAKDFKKANSTMQEIIEKIKEAAKKNNVEIGSKK